MDALWQYALAAWRKPAVEAACLRLQDDYQVSAPLLLCGCWLAEMGYPLQPRLAQALVQCAQQWEQEHIAPLRTVRRHASQKPQWQQWKRSLQEAELQAERLLLSELEQMVAAQPPALAASASEDWLLLLVPDAATCEGQAALLRSLWDAVA